MKKAWGVLAVFLALVLGCCGGCAGRQRVTRLPEDGSLEGLRLGVVLGWNSDIYMDQVSPYKELNPVRYNTMANAVLDMKYGHVDLLALEMASAAMLCRTMPAFTIVGEPLAEDDIVLFVAPGKEALRDEYNAFIGAFKQTAEYADLKARADASFLGDFDYQPVPVPEDGPILTVVCEEYYPFSYWDFESDCVAGVEVELVSRFASARGYRLNYVFSSYTAAVTDLMAGEADMMADGLSDYYRELAQMTGLLCTDPHYTTLLVWVAVGDASGLQNGIAEDLLDY